MGVLIGYSNRIDTSTLSNGSWLAGLPLGNIQSRILGKVARSTNALNASTKMDIDLGESKAIRIISVVNHNLSIDATYRIRGATDAGFTTVTYDSGTLDVYGTVYLPEDLEWEIEPWLWEGTYSDEEISGYTTNLVHILPTVNFPRYWRIEFFDTTNVAGYVQVGRVFLGNAWEPANDAEVGASIGWESTTTTTRALSGARYFQRKTPYRVTRFTLNVMSVDEAMARAFEIDKLMGIDGEVLYVFDSNDTLHALRRQYLGTLRQLSPIEFPHSNLLSKSYEIEELL